MAEAEFKPKNVEDYVKSTFENPFKAIIRLAESHIEQSKKIHEFNKRLSKIENDQKNTRIYIEKEEIKKYLGEELGPEIDKAKKGLESIIYPVKKYLGLTTLTTAGVLFLVVLATGIGFVYLKNKTVTGNIMKIEGNIKNIGKLTSGIKEDYKKYGDEIASLKKSAEDKATYQKNLEEQAKSYSDQITELKSSYEKQINDLKDYGASYKMELGELGKQKQDYDKKFDELESRVSGAEGRLNGLIKNQKSQKK